MDEARLEQLDAAPLKADLARSTRSRAKIEFAQLHGRHAQAGFGSRLVRPGVRPPIPSIRRSTRFTSATGGLGLPDRDYYLLDKYKPQRDAYRAYIAADAGDDRRSPMPTARRDQILAFETEIAKLSWPIADLRDIDKINNPMTLAELAAYAPGLDWARIFAAPDRSAAEA